MIKVRLVGVEDLLRSNRVMKMSEELLRDNGYPNEAVEFFSNGCVYPKGSNKSVTIVKIIKDEQVALLSNDYYVDIAWLSPSIITYDDYIRVGNRNYDYNLQPITLTKCTTCGEKISMFSPDGCNCMKCFTKSNSKLNNYSYKPAPKFIGEQPSTDKDNPVWYGIELELSLKDAECMAKLKYNHSKDNEKFYLKSDASIYSCSYPVELVSHPHSYKEIMTAKWIDDIATLNLVDSNRQYETNGVHIHISNTAFIDDAHYAKWYFFTYSMTSGVLQKICGRELTDYCKPTRYGSIVTKRLEPRGDYDRAVVINERNNNTREVRVFSTTNDPKVLRRYIQFLESTIKYSKYARAKLSYDGWVAYISKYATKYEYLMECILGLGNVTKPKAVKVPNKLVIVNRFDEIPSSYLGNITRIHISGDWRTVSSILIDFASSSFRLNGRESNIPFDRIQEIEYAR